MSRSVSIIVPVYNSSDYLDECLSSVRNQTLQDLEIICINDGSTDNSLDILKKHAFEDDRILIINKANAGYGAAINDGLTASTGEYIGIVESDDYILPDMYRRYYELAKEHDLDFVKSDFKRFWGDGDNRTFEDRILGDSEAYYNKVLNPSNNTELLRLNNLSQPGVYRRSFLNKKGIRLNESPGASYQDNGFWFQVFTLASSAMFLHDPHYMLRRDNPNSSVFSTEKVFCACEEYDFIRQKLIDLDRIERLGACAYYRFCNYEFTCGRIAEQRLPQFFERYAEDFLLLANKGELDRSFFSPSEWTRLQSIMGAGKQFYLTHWLPSRELLRARQAEGAEREHKEALANSISFKAGRILTKPPRWLRDHVSHRTPAQDLIRPRPIWDTPEYKFAEALSPEELPGEIERLYAERMGGLLDLASPISYNEKVQLRKISDPFSNLKAKLTDKYEVRDWVSDRVGNQLLVPLLGVWDSFDEIDFTALPQRFVLKATHGCAMTCIVRDKTHLDKEDVRAKFHDWLRTNYAFCNGLETHYRPIRPRIIAEEYLENSNEDLFDYKFWCFNGRVEYIQFLSNRAHGLRMSFFDRSWNLQPFRYDHAPHTEAIPRPDNLSAMIEIAEKLAAGFDHVRVDLYSTPDSGIRFGEMTFSSASGYCHWIPSDADFKLGALWKID